MGLFDKMKEPVFTKASSSAYKQQQQLEELLKTAPDTVKPEIEAELRSVNAGIFGENSIEFELRNSHLPMFILHDLYLTCNDLSAQIDYLIITRKCNFVIECKNLYGDIEINNSGAFIRTMHYGRHVKKEGIYSPVTQNRRHLELIKQLRMETRTNAWTKSLFERNFYHNYRAIVVLANPKTVLNDRYATIAVREQVIRADHLVDYICRINSSSNLPDSSDREMEQLAQFFLSQHRENATDYTAKFAEAIRKAQASPEPAEAEKETSPEPCIPAVAEQPPAVSPAPVLPSPAVSAPTAPDSEASAETDTVISCPRCGAPMVLRKAAKGKNAGNCFYGCSRFPKCYGIVNIKP